MTSSRDEFRAELVPLFEPVGRPALALFSFAVGVHKKQRYKEHDNPVGLAKASCHNLMNTDYEGTNSQGK
jgi:hypothetical protein